MTLNKELQGFLNLDLLYSIHTFEILHPFSFTEGQQIIKNLYSYAQANHTRAYSKQTTHYFYTNYPGIRIRMKHAKCRAYLFIECNLKSAATGSVARVELFDSKTDNLYTVHENLKKLLHEIALSTPLCEFRFSQVHFCVNIPVQDVGEYLKLSKKGNRPAGFKPQFSHFTDGDRIAFERSHDLDSKARGVTVSVYDKYAQLSADPNATPESIQTSKNILRFEVRMNAMALCKHKGQEQSIHFHIDWIGTFLSEASKILQTYAVELFPKGTHYKLNTAKQHISNAVRNPTKAERLTYWVEFSSQTQCCSKGLQSVATNYNLEHKQAKSLMEYMQDLGINPVTIASRSPYQALPSLLSILGIE